VSSSQEYNIEPHSKFVMIHDAILFFMLHNVKGILTP